MLEQMPASMITEWAAHFRIKNAEFKNRREQTKLQKGLKKKRGR